MKEIEYLALSGAAAIVYRQLAGARDVATAEEWHAALDDVAAMISKVTPVFATDEASGARRAIPVAVLAEGRFAGGATLFVDARGGEWADLCIRRADLRDALFILQAARS